MIFVSPFPNIVRKCWAPMRLLFSTFRSMKNPDVWFGDVGVPEAVRDYVGGHYLKDKGVRASIFAFN